MHTPARYRIGFLRTASAAATAIAFAHLAAAQPTLTPLGVLAPADSSGAPRISGDGSVVVGVSPLVPGSAATTPFRWTSQGGMSLLLPEGCRGRPTGISFDGTIVTGVKGGGCALPNPEAGGFYVSPSETRNTRPTEGISADGLWWTGNYLTHPYIESLSTLQGVNGFDSGNAFAIANPPTGPVVVGRMMTGFTGTISAFRWTSATGPVSLGASTNAAYAITPDGGIIAGTLHPNGNGGAFRWTAAAGAQPLGGASPWQPAGIAQDGGVIIGTSLSGSQAVVWTNGLGSRPLAQALSQEYGLDITGWTFLEATGISADGTAIVGTAVTPSGRTEAFVARGLCRAATIQQHPAGVSVAAGEAAQFSVQAAGAGLTYRWQHNNVDLIDGGRISGATTATLTIAAARPSDNGAYRVVITTPTCGTATSNAAALDVTCPAGVDVDGNGSVQPADIGLFVAMWVSDLGSGQLRTDFDGNGAVEPGDIATFVSAWFGALSAGC